MSWMLLALSLMTGLAVYGLVEIVKKCVSLWRGADAESYFEELLEMEPRRCPTCHRLLANAFSRAPATTPLSP